MFIVFISRAAGDRWRACVPRPQSLSLRPPRSNRHRGAATSAGACALVRRARAQRRLFPGWIFGGSRSSSCSSPPRLGPPRPGTSVWSRQRSGPCLVLPGLRCCALVVRGTTHGDGSSERAVRAAGESGDDHDGPQLHPALPARSPEGIWVPATRACPETLPQPQPFRRSPRRWPSPAHAAPGPRSQPRGALPLAALRASSHSPPSLLAAPTLFPGRSGPCLTVAVSSHRHSPLPSPPPSPLLFTLLRTRIPSTAGWTYFILTPTFLHPISFPWSTCPTRPQHRPHSLQSPYTKRSPAGTHSWLALTEPQPLLVPFYLYPYSSP